MKSKDFFTTLKTQGKISSDEFDAFIESVPDFEMPDGAFKSFEEKFMTVERASTHPELNSMLRARALSPMDNDLSTLINVIGSVDPYAANEISKIVRVGGNGKSTPDTYKQLAAVVENLPKILDKVKVAPNDEDAKKTIESQKRAISELTEKFTKAEADYDKRGKAMQAEFDGKMSEYHLTSKLEKMADSYNFADAYQDARPELTKAILGEIRSGNLLEIAKNSNNEDEIQIMEMKDGVKSPKFNGNTPVTIKALLDDKFKKFMKVNGTDPTQQMRHIQYQDGGQGGQQQRVEARRGASTEVR